jgi:hypothetical protein
MDIQWNENMVRVLRKNRRDKPATVSVPAYCYRKIRQHLSESSTFDAMVVARGVPPASGKIGGTDIQRL